MQPSADPNPSPSTCPQNLLKDSEGTGSQWISDLKGIEVLSSFEPSTLPAEVHSAAVVHLYHLAMPAPLQGRTFLSFVLTATPSEDCFWNVSVPLEDEDYVPGEGDEEGRVRARQVSVERVRRVGEEIEWTFVHAFVLVRLENLPLPVLRRFADRLKACFDGRREEVFPNERWTAR